MVPQSDRDTAQLMTPKGILSDFNIYFINVKSLLLSLVETLSIHGTDLCLQE